MRLLIALLAVILATGSAFAQDDGRDPNWFRKHLKRERRSGVLREQDIRQQTPQPGGAWWPGGKFYLLPDGTQRAVDAGGIVPRGWIEIGYYLPSRKVLACQPQHYRWDYVADCSKPGCPVSLSLVPAN